MAGYGSEPAADQANNPARQVGPHTYTPASTTPSMPSAPSTAEPGESED